jgi:hypothetical protein
MKGQLAAARIQDLVSLNDANGSSGDVGRFHLFQRYLLQLG